MAVKPETLTINGSEITWEDLDAFAHTSMTGEELRKYMDSDRRDSAEMLRRTAEGRVFLIRKAAKKGIKGAIPLDH